MTTYHVRVNNKDSGTVALDDTGLKLEAQGYPPIAMGWNEIESASGTPLANRRASVLVIPAAGEFVSMSLKEPEARELVDEVRRSKTYDRSSAGWWGQLPDNFGVPLVGRLLHDPTGQASPGAACRAGAWPAGLTVNAAQSRHLVRWSAVTGLSVEGIDQLRNRPSVGAVAVFGVLGLAATQKEAEAYMTVSTDYGDWVLEVGGTLPSHLKARLSSVLRQLEPPTSTRPQEPSEADPVEMIRRLGELRDQGLLSDAEFESKKAELLGRM